MRHPFLPLAARRRRGGGGGGGVPPSLPVNVTPPTLVLLNDTTLQYTRGVWTGTEPITFEAELEINGSFVRVVEPGPIAIEGPWLGGTATIWETATNDQGSGNVGAGPLQLPAPDPEDALVSWLAGRVGYGVDPNDLGSLFRDTAGTLPVTTDGQPVALARSKFDPVSPDVADFLQATVALQPAYRAGSIDPDGVDDILPYNYGVTAVLPIFQGINGFVASVFVELASLATNQVVWVSGFGGTVANFRHRIRVTTAGAIQFSAQDAQNGAPVSVLSATGLITVGAKALITLAVDHDAKVLKGYLNGVEVASLALPNNVSPFNYDINRVRFFAQHGNTATELFGGKLYRAFFFHEKVDAAGRRIIENWVGEFAA